ncbi:hypothetical protein [uncultured Alistipes sp.]|uniref:hypothetical protein n=1 Tax=uncultured Alistipes sp. TaxID=538949 RepID=UPI0026334373|nr:hypothetical protein [uncultured Alistipes sp.]
MEKQQVARKKCSVFSGTVLGAVRGVPFPFSFPFPFSAVSESVSERDALQNI